MTASMRPIPSSATCTFSGAADGCFTPAPAAELPDLPREHVFFHGSHYALSLIDVSRLWNGLDGKPQLSFISSNYGPLNE